MNEREVSRLDLLRFLERVQERDLARTRGWIKAEEQRLAELANRRPPPPPPDYVVQHGLGRGPAIVHQGFCEPQAARVRAISADEARRLLSADAGLACQLCRPDTALGLL
ncbi:MULTISPECIES: DUF6233 domain-containing protein [unclassified Streptomyces]|uniref:DUF6233 domain-containing protein n=1 Tax=unclassified Streptomyces TaxID=2593676 RepID=UPI00081E85B3|nr:MULTISPECIES: DUF6233 domain-containing protein [unclassified Streptomyces]MYR93079.1 hypothetical protein [Streptomyces sp. SID4937]SCD46078.1 hypothetical protein GA0115243_102158 [Streptomyces sp. ScaeMP-e83]